MLKIYCKLRLLFCTLIIMTQVALAKVDSIFVYADEGVGVNSLNDALNFFSSKTDYKVLPIYAIDIISGEWQENAALLVFPGGADLKYSKKLNGLGNKMIYDYVAGGGTFLGICAGAYYASAFVDFARDTNMAIIGPRELKFFPGTCFGPMYTTTTFDDRRDAKSIYITWKDQKYNQPLGFNQEAPVYYFGGGYFENAMQYPQTQILASYDCCQQYPAIVSNKVGLGRAILSSVHFEYQPKYVPETDENFKNEIMAINRELKTNHLALVLQNQMLFELFSN
jgi:glutamine amidotransferase-like uncharacterized protein